MAAKVKLEIVNTKKFARDVITYFSETELPKIFREVKSEIDDGVREAFIESFYNTTAVRGLLGEFVGMGDLDLQAQFGLYPGLGFSAVREMVSAIQETLETSGLVVRKTGISFNISFNRLADVIRANVTEGSYDSNGNDINWLDWLLDGSSPVFDYRIKFTSSSSARGSRSGRAYMIPNGTWSFQALGGVSRFGNFIEDAIRDPNFQNKVNTLIANKIRERG
jgi:hypothetical protein